MLPGTQGRAPQNEFDSVEEDRSVGSAVDLAGQHIAIVFAIKVSPWPGGTQGVVSTGGDSKVATRDRRPSRSSNGSVKTLHDARVMSFAVLP